MRKDEHEPTFHSSLFPSEMDIDLEVDEDTQANSNKRSIGKILVDAGIITLDDAHKVIEYQREHKLRFGEAAVRMGMIAEGDIRYALSYQFEYSYLPRASGKLTNPELVAAYKPFSHEVDQLRSIRSQLLLHWFEKADRTMLAVVGAGRAEGGSYLTANLAIVFAQMGERTLLIDADMRFPKQHVLFDVNNQLGFSSLLAGRSDVASALHKIPFMANIDLITAGPVPPNPLELLNRANLDELLDWAAKQYDIVLIDTPALTCGEDALIIAGRARSALVVARTNETNSAAFAGMVKNLKKSNINVVGSVLNNPPQIDIGE